MRRHAVIALLFFSCTIWAQEPRLVNYSSADGLPSNTVYVIAQDTDGVLWVGTRNGLARFDGVQFRSWKEYGRVNALTVDRENRLWVGTTDGLRVKEDRIEGNIRALLADSEGYVWATVGDTLLLKLSYKDGIREEARCWYDKRDSEGDYPYYQIFEASDGKLWLAGRIVRFQYVEDKNRPEVMHPFGNGGFCAGSFAEVGGKLYAFDDHTSLLYTYEDRAVVLHGRLPIAHARLLTDSKGRLWAAGSYGIGPVNLEKPDDTPVYKTPSTELYCLFEDRQGNIWTGGDNGLYFIDTDGSVGLVPKELGFPSDIYGEHVSCTLRDGSLSFGGACGAIVFHPDSLLGIKAAGTLPLEGLVRHRYRLNSGDWNEGRFIGLTDNIRPGRHSLEEQSSDIFGRWNQRESVLQLLRVPPPIWLRWPFLLGYLLLLSAIVYTVMKLRERRLLVKELDMRNRLFSIISHDLRGPVSGNYILSRELLEKVDGLSKVQLKEALAELSASAENASSLLENLLLWSLSQKGMLKPVMREVNLLGIAKEAVGSVRGQDVITVDIPENLIVRTDRNMLLTILRNLLDNAVKASQHSDIPGAPVILRSEATKDLLHARQIVIIDNGLGLREEAPEWGHGLGLVITRELLDKLCARMEMHNRPEGGLQITIDL